MRLWTAVDWFPRRMLQALSGYTRFSQPEATQVDSTPSTH